MMTNDEECRQAIEELKQIRKDITKVMYRINPDALDKSEKDDDG